MTRKINYRPTSPDFVPDITGEFIVSVDCFRCGNKTRLVIDRDDEFDRAESDYWQDRYYSLMGSVNSLISDTENRSGWNPAKEAFMSKLLAIRDELK